MPAHLQAHCQSPTSQRFNQSFVKELAKPTREKNFKIFLSRLKEKIKTRQHTGDTDRKENEKNDKFNMKEQFDSNSQTDMNRQCITCGIFYCRVSAEINGCGSLQTSSWLDSDMLRNRQQKHTAKRWQQV